LNKRDDLVRLEPMNIFFFTISGPSTPTMENPIDRTIRLMAIAAGVVNLLVYAVFQFV
jgi:hypothetical protein